MPKRIQRKRTKGWRMPEGAVYVGRPTVFGNPFEVAAVVAARAWTGQTAADAEELRAWTGLGDKLTLATWEGRLFVEVITLRGPTALQRGDVVVRYAPGQVDVLAPAVFAELFEPLTAADVERVVAIPPRRQP